MLMTLGQLRELILREMKLGIASANPPSEAYGVVDDEERGDESDPLLHRPEFPDFDPGDILKLAFNHRRRYDMAGDPFDPFEEKGQEKPLKAVG